MFVDENVMHSNVQPEWVDIQVNRRGKYAPTKKGHVRKGINCKAGMATKKCSPRHSGWMVNALADADTINGASGTSTLAISDTNDPSGASVTTYNQ